MFFIATEYETKCSKSRQKIIDDVITMAGNTIFNRMRNPIYINIRPIRKLAEKKGIYGDCLYEDDRDFTIRIDVSIPIDEMISTLLHELVHVHQYLSKRMRQSEPNKVTFEGTVYDWDMEYDKRPWEIEAHTKEKQLKELWDGRPKYRK